VVIGGFIITGTQDKTVLIRAIGPSLSLPSVLADPFLRLFDSTGRILATNDNWEDSPNIVAITNSGIPPTNEKESAIIGPLSPGAYTAIVTGANATTGIALVEVYDLDRGADSQLANISTRGLVQTGDVVMIGGIIILGEAPATTLIRALGPSLGLRETLSDPMLEMHDGDGNVIASNDNWKETQQAAIEATGIPPPNDAESAILATLIPGDYTAIVRGKNGSTGLALVEAYHLQQ